MKALRSLTVSGVLAVALLGPPALSSQSGRGSVHGYVAFEDFSYNDVASGAIKAKVELRGLGEFNHSAFTTETDRRGSFDFAGVGMGEYTLRIMAPGHRTWQADIYVPSDFEGRIAVMLKKNRPGEQSPLGLTVLDARSDQLTVEAAVPLAWTVIEVDPLGRLRLLYGDSGLHAELTASLPIDPGVAREGRLAEPGPMPVWTTPCVAQGNEVVTDPESGVRLYAGPQCLRTGSGRVDAPPAVDVSGYWLILGTFRPPARAAMARALRTVRPVSNPTALAETMMKVLFGKEAVAWGAAAIPIPSRR